MGKDQEPFRVLKTRTIQVQPCQEKQLRHSKIVPKLKEPVEEPDVIPEQRKKSPKKSPRRKKGQKKVEEPTKQPIALLKYDEMEQQMMEKSYVQDAMFQYMRNVAWDYATGLVLFGTSFTLAVRFPYNSMVNWICMMGLVSTTLAGYKMPTTYFFENQDQELVKFTISIPQGRYIVGAISIICMGVIAAGWMTPVICLGMDIEDMDPFWMEACAIMLVYVFLPASMYIGYYYLADKNTVLAMYVLKGGIMTTIFLDWYNPNNVLFFASLGTICTWYIISAIIIVQHKFNMINVLVMNQLDMEKS